MGWRGLMRSWEASGRRAQRERIRRHNSQERDERRHRRELEVRAREFQKQTELQQAAFEVEEYENHLRLIGSIHRDCSPPFDWHAAYIAQPPAQPTPTSESERRAHAAMQAYRPGFFSKLFGTYARTRKLLSDDVQRAKVADAEANRLAHQAYVHAYAQWDKLRQLSHGVLSGDTNAYRAALEALGSFDELEDLECPVDLRSCLPHLLEAVVRVNSDDLVPDEIKALTSAGKLTRKKMPVSKSSEIYQDYVCGAVLRAGREALAALPVSMVLVHAIAKMLNPQTGHLQDYAVMSAAMPRSTMSGINFTTVDASDSMRGFLSRMSFHKTKGMSPIDPIRVDELQRHT